MFDELSSHAARFDQLATFLFGVGVFFSVLIFALMIIFCLLYRRKGLDDRGGGPKGSIWLESTWAFIPFLIMVGIFIWGANLYMDLFKTKPYQNNVSVMAKRWMWKFYYSTGKEEVNTLYVPADKTTQLMMISEDVIHSLYLPDLRVKKDVLPGRYIRLYVHPTKVGEYPIYCAEFCGTDHSRMRAVLKVLSKEDFEKWLHGPAERAQALQVAKGQKLFEKHQCSSCHRQDDSSLAPDLFGMFGKTVALSDGHQVLVNEDYLRTSIVDPQAQIHDGYPPAMPTFQGQLNEEQLLALVDYLRSLSKENKTQ